MNSNYWSFERIELMPMLRVKGKTNSEFAKNFLIGQAVIFIENALKFHGFPFQHGNVEKSDYQTCVYFTLMFQNQQQIQQYLESIR